MSKPQLPEGYSSFKDLPSLPTNGRIVEKFEPKQSSPANDIARMSLWKKGYNTEGVLSILLGVNVLRKLMGDYEINEVVVSVVDDLIRVVPNVERALKAFDIKGARKLHAKATIDPDMQSDDGVIIRVRAPEQKLKMPEGRWSKTAVPYVIVQADGVYGIDFVMPDDWLPEDKRLTRRTSQQLLNTNEQPDVPPEAFHMKDQPVITTPPVEELAQVVTNDPDVNVLKDETVETFLSEQRDDMANVGPVVETTDEPVFEPAFFHPETPQVRNYPPVPDGQNEAGEPVLNEPVRNIASEIVEGLQEAANLIDDHLLAHIDPPIPAAMPDQKDEVADIIEVERFVVGVENIGTLTAAQQQLTEAIQMVNELLTDGLLAQSVVLGIENGKLVATAKEITIEAKKLV